MTTHPRGRRRGGWTDWALVTVFAFQVIIPVVDRDWDGLALPAVLFVGYTTQLLLSTARRSTAATAVLWVTFAALVVVAFLQRTWWMVVVLGVVGLVLVGVRGVFWWLERKAGARD